MNLETFRKNNTLKYKFEQNDVMHDNLNILIDTNILMNKHLIIKTILGQIGANDYFRKIKDFKASLLKLNSQSKLCTFKIIIDEFKNNVKGLWKESKKTKNIPSEQVNKILKYLLKEIKEIFYVVEETPEDIDNFHKIFQEKLRTGGKFLKQRDGHDLNIMFLCFRHNISGILTEDKIFYNKDITKEIFQLSNSKRKNLDNFFTDKLEQGTLKRIIYFMSFTCYPLNKWLNYFVRNIDSEKDFIGITFKDQIKIKEVTNQFSEVNDFKRINEKFWMGYRHKELILTNNEIVKVFQHIQMKCILSDDMNKITFTVIPQSIWFPMNKNGFNKMEDYLLTFGNFCINIMSSTLFQIDTETGINVNEKKLSVNVDFKINKEKISLEEHTENMDEWSITSDSCSREEIMDHKWNILESKFWK